MNRAKMVMSVGELFMLFRLFVEYLNLIFAVFENRA